MSSKARTTDPRRSLCRTGILVVACAAILGSATVLSLREPAPPPAPTFSEQALSAAHADTERLRSAVTVMAESAAGEATGTAELSGTVTLLTVQGRALLPPLPAAADQPAPSPAPSPSAAPQSVPEFLDELTASAAERFSDAQRADGGTARLLVAAGTGQLLEAGALATAFGLPVPEVPDPAPGGEPTTDAARAHSAGPTALGSVLPSAPESAPLASGSAAVAPQCLVPASPELPAALNAVVETERQSDYGYQVALPRLSGDAGAYADTAWSRHRQLMAETVSFLAGYCLEAPPAVAGYALGADFLTAPASGLGALEAGALPVYGDLVAFGEGALREWACRTLLESAQRAAGWGADTGELPGLGPETTSMVRQGHNGLAEGTAGTGSGS